MEGGGCHVERYMMKNRGKCGKIGPEKSMKIEGGKMLFWEIQGLLCTGAAIKTFPAYTVCEKYGKTIRKTENPKEYY